MIGGWYRSRLASRPGNPPTRQCTADAGVCPCAAKSVALALHTTCSKVNDHGSCAGARFCSPEGLTECDASMPVEEVCDGVDSDCDGTADEGTCDAAAGCEHTAIEGAACDDGDHCTAGDHCSGVVCAGTPAACNDNNACTDDTCGADGECVFAPNIGPCDDGDPCTLVDQCLEGACEGVTLPCECVIDADCMEFEDDDACNGTLFCDTSVLPFKCVTQPDTVVACAAAENPCQAAACDPLTGDCHLLAASGLAR